MSLDDSPKNRKRSKSRMHSEIVEARIIEIREERARSTFRHSLASYLH